MRADITDPVFHVSNSRCGCGQMVAAAATERHQLAEVTGRHRVSGGIEVLNPALEALPGFKEVRPVVFCGLFPVDAADFDKLRESISKLRLNDASFSFETESSAALGLASAAASSASSTSRSSRSG